MRPEKPESGFRRWEAFKNALLASDVARMCGDWPSPSPSPAPPLDFDEPERVEAARPHLAELDAIARGGVPLARRGVFLAYPPAEVRFLLADDIDDVSARLRAIVARAYARSDAVAWGLAQVDEDVRRRSGRELPAGRPTTTEARTWFVLRLAVAWALLTGERPSLHGGGDKEAARNPRGVSWRRFAAAALNLTRTYGGVGLDSVFSRAMDANRSGTSRRPEERLPKRWFQDHIRSLADAAAGRASDPWAIHDASRRLTSYGELPEAGIEDDAYLGAAPTNRAAAYAPPSSQYEGLH